MDVDKPAAAPDAQQQAATPGAAAAAPPAAASGGAAAGAAAAGSPAPSAGPASAAAAAAAAGVKASRCCNVLSLFMGCICPLPSLPPGSLAPQCVPPPPTHTHTPPQAHRSPPVSPPSLCPPQQPEGGAAEGKESEAEKARQRAEQARREMEANSGDCLFTVEGLTHSIEFAMRCRISVCGGEGG
jgi:hypothetical protein